MQKWPNVFKARTTSRTQDLFSVSKTIKEHVDWISQVSLEDK